MTLAGLYLNGLLRWLILETLHSFDSKQSRRNIDCKVAWCVKQMFVQRTDAFVRIARCVDFAIGCFLIDARLRLLSGLAVDNTNRDCSHRPRPSSRCDSNQLLLAAPTLHQLQLRQTLLVRNIGDPFSIWLYGSPPAAGITKRLL